MVDGAVPVFKPVDLDRHPEVDALLIGLGLGPFVRDTLTAPPGRNDAWTGQTTGGRDVFVKKLVGPESDVADRMGRLLGFECFRDARAMPALRAPKLMASDTKANLVVFERVSGRNGAELMVDETFDDELAQASGRAIGALHAATPADGERFDQSLPSQPPHRFLEALPHNVFETLSFAELQGWRLMQTDQQLIAAVTALREREVAAPKVPSHCDLRVDQFLIDGRDIHITDWEEFRLADPARDVGSFVGEWLYRSILDITTTRGDTVFVDAELTHETVLHRGAEKMNRLLPKVRHFWRGYREQVRRPDPGLTARATAFAGWHMLDRLMANASRVSRLSGIERAAAGIGRAAMLTPEKFSHAIGLDESA